MEFNLATLFELAVDQFGDREYLVSEGKRCTYTQMEQRAKMAGLPPGRAGYWRG